MPVLSSEDLSAALGPPAYERTCISPEIGVDFSGACLVAVSVRDTVFAVIMIGCNGLLGV
jgi:hypothetical protein